MKDRNWNSHILLQRAGRNDVRMNEL